MIIDRLYEEVEKKGNVCVGLDTAYDYLPNNFKAQFTDEGEAVFAFNKKIIDATKDEAACFKVQIAYYEALGLKGMTAYMKTLKYIKENGKISIADIKRGDIADTAKMYAKAHFQGDFESDFITLAPYMGMDSIEAYENYFATGKKGAFVLVRTSNKGFGDFQKVEDKNGKLLFNTVGEKLGEMGKKYMGSCGYSLIGGVVGCTHIEESKEARKQFGSMYFLIPGYGAQGGGGIEAAAYLKEGNGGVVNSSRGILLAYRKVEGGEEIFDECARKEVLRMKEDILNGAKVRWL